MASSPEQEAPRADPEAPTALSGESTSDSRVEETRETRELVGRLGLERFGGDHAYRDFATVGEGGVGLVHRAYEPNLGRQVAIKVLRPELRAREQYVERLIREARATAQIEHPNIVPVYCLAATDDLGVFFAMKYLQGDTLRNVLERLRERNPEYVKKYPRVRLLNTFLKVCNGISYAHSKGIVHRDLKPENVLIGEYGEVVVLDWGLVRQINPTACTEKQGGRSDETDETGTDVEIDIKGGTTPNLTVEGAVNGTPKYMAPEQARGHNSMVDCRSDIYSLGTMLYEMLTLRPAFPQSETKEILRAVGTGEFQSPRRLATRHTVSRELEAVCLNAMALRKEDRYQSVQQIIEDIYAFLDQRPVSVYRAPLLIRFWKLCLRHPVISAIVAVALITLILAAATITLVQRAHYHTLPEKSGATISVGKAEFAGPQRTRIQLDARRRSRVTKEEPAAERRLALEHQRRESIAESHFELAGESPLIPSDVGFRYVAPLQDPAD